VLGRFFNCLNVLPCAPTQTRSHSEIGRREPIAPSKPFQDFALPLFACLDIRASSPVLNPVCIPATELTPHRQRTITSLVAYENSWHDEHLEIQRGQLGLGMTSIWKDST